MSIQVTILNVM